MLVMKRLYLRFEEDLQDTVFIYQYLETFVRSDVDIQNMNYIVGANYFNS